MRRIFAHSPLLIACFWSFLPGLSLASPVTADSLMAEEVVPEKADIALRLGVAESLVLQVGEELALPALVNNFGEDVSPPATLVFLWSTDDELSESDVELARAPIASLKPGSGSGLSWRGIVKAEPGRYWAGACLEFSFVDADNSNNCTAAIEVLIPDVDLEGRHMEVTPVMLVSGLEILARATIYNLGQQPSQPTDLNFYLSISPTISKADTVIASNAVPEIESGERWAAVARIKIARKPGEYWIGACVTPLAGEKSEKNNCTPGELITVVKDEFPDLAVQAVRVRPMEWPEGATVDFYAEVVNLGAKSSAPTSVSFFLSNDSDIADGDLLAGTADLESIGPDDQSDAYVFVNLSVIPGIYWVGACVEPDDEEFDTFNNCAVGPQVEITEFDFSQPSQ